MNTKKTVIINIVEDKNPLAVLRILKPIFDQLEDVGLRMPATWYFDLICNLPEALLESSSIAGMDPENPGIWRCRSDPMTKLDCKLGFALMMSVNVHTTFLLGCSVLTQHRRGRLALPSTLGRKFFLQYHQGSCRGPQSPGHVERG